MSKQKDIVINLLLDGKQFNATIQNSDKLARQLKGSVTGVGDKMAKWSMMVTGFNQGLQAAKQVTSLFTGTLDAYKKQEQANMKVETAVRSTGMAAGYSAEQLKVMASELQKITTFGDETILNDVTAQLLTFTNITGEQFKRAQIAAMDLSTVLDGDLKSASIMLGKALNDPIQGLTAMRRVGIAFTDEQQKTIKALIDENKLMEAQTIILDELGRQYGGQAEARAKTRTGEIQQAENQLGDAVEKIGGLTALVAAPLMKMFAGATEGIVNLIIPTEKYSDQLRDQQIEFNALMNIMRDDTIERETKKLVIDQLNSNYKEYLGNLDLEKASIEDIAKAQKEANMQFDKKIKMQAGQETYAEYMQELASTEKRIMNAQVELKKIQKDFDINEFTLATDPKKKVMYDFAAAPYLGSIESWKKDIAEKKAEFKSFMDYLEKEGINLNESLSGNKPNTGNKDGKENKDKTKTDMFDSFFTITDLMDEQREKMDEMFSEQEKQWIAEQERIIELNQLKDEYFNAEIERAQMEKLELETIKLSMDELDNKLLIEQMNRSELENQMRIAETAAEFKDLQSKKKLSDEKIKIIQAEKQARQEATLSMIQAGIDQYNAAESLGRNLNRLANEAIKRIIAEAVATQLAKVIASLPWPFNLFVAPAAGFAVQALLEELIPSFAKGVTNFKGGVALVGEQGPELVNLPAGSDVIPNRESSRLIFNDSASGSALVVNAIERLGDRMERIERIVKLDSNSFDEAYSDYKASKQYLATN